MARDVGGVAAPGWRANVNLELTSEQKLLQQTVREFAASEVKPHARELDETGRFPR